MEKHFVFDFDSTFISVEGLEALAEISLSKSKNKNQLLEEISRLTIKGMDGSMRFEDALEKRIKILEAKKDQVEILVKKLKKKISTSILRNKDFFKKNAAQVYVVSAGFKEFILPIVKPFGIKEENVFANSFRFDKNGKLIGFDKGNVLSRSNGKRDLLKSLRLKGEVYVIGDSHSDYMMKTGGNNIHFIAFTENIKRPGLAKKADHVAPSFDEFLYKQKLPMTISYPKNRIKVLLLENIHPSAEKMFQKEGYEVETFKDSMGEKELSEKIKGVSILGIRSKTHLTEKVIANANSLLTAGAFCIGTNQIDLKAATDKGICVFNAPYSNTRSVVELVIGELILLMRGIPNASKLMHEGVWKKSAKGSFEVRGKKLGIVGYGNIGSQLSVLAEGLGMQVFFYDKVDKLALGNAKKCNTMKELLRISDVVTLHVDGDKANTNLIGDAEFKSMKKGSVFMNLSRGHVVNIPALAKHLRSGQLAGASIDVFPHEPAGNNDPFESELKGIPNLILTPHIGGSTEEAQANIADYVPSKIIQYINTGASFGSVTFPQIQLPELKNSHRLIHIHQNVPGILASINHILATHKINIEGQYLKTNEEIGYSITDISKKYSEQVLRELRNIPHTIRFRVLY